MDYIAQFTKVLLANSVADNYQDAIQEWIYVGDGDNHPNTCICGHPIIQNCLVDNKLNGNRLTIGNCCIKKFGIQKINYNKSAKHYMAFAAQVCTSDLEDKLVSYLSEQLHKYGRVYMNETQKKALELITGKEYKWIYK